MWSPASTVWTNRVASIAGEQVVAGAESFAKTPVVFGMPESMARALGYPDQPVSMQQIHDLIQNPDGWGSVGKPTWGSFKIAKTNPNSSTTGMSMLLMQAYTASAKGIDSAGMKGFEYQIVASGAKSTVALPTGWTSTAGYWVTRKDGSC